MAHFFLFDLYFKKEDFPNPMLKGSFLVTTCVGILTGLIH